MNTDLEVILFANCKIVRGSVFSTICDLQRSKVFHISNEIADLVFKSLGQSKTDFISSVDFNHGYSGLEIWNFLDGNDLVDLVPDASLFPQMDDYWDEPFRITNVILDIQEDLNWLDYLKFAFNGLSVKAVQLRFFEEISKQFLIGVVSELSSIGIFNLELVTQYKDWYEEDTIYDIFDKYPSVTMLLLYNSPIEKQYALRSEGSGFVYFAKDKVFDKKNCGVVQTDSFVINYKHYTESLSYNSCLNRKVSIDSEGNIKNCPSMTESFGNIRDTSLAEAIEKPGFKKYWDINKDKIHVCKDCEFRYICTDCRAYVEDPEDIYSKPLKCGYNPYTGEWSEWSTNPLKQKAIEFYGMEELVAERQERLKEKEGE